MILRRLLFAISFASIAFSKIMAATIPTWLPSEYRFDVDGTSNEVRQVEDILTAMRDGINPAMRKFVEKNGLWGPYFQWVVRWSMPGVTNDTQYLTKLAHPKVFSISDFDMNRLTNVAARACYMAPTVKLKLEYDDGTRTSVERPKPNKDYPGVDYEDAGSLPNSILIALRLPKYRRRFRFSACSDWSGDLEYCWVLLCGNAHVGPPPEYKYCNLPSGISVMDALVNYRDISACKKAVVGVFCRERNKRIWGPPSFITVTVDPLSRHVYSNSEAIISIDYFNFKDYYSTDENNKIVGFSRMNNGSVKTETYSRDGELVIERYANDMPKQARPVEYYVSDGRLKYRVLNEIKSYKYSQLENAKW